MRRHLNEETATILILVLLAQALLAVSISPEASAHLTGGIMKITGRYKIQFLVLPRNPIPDENATLNFSVQDLNSNNLRNITATITITVRNTTVFLAPRQLYAYGDFLLTFVFHQEDTYVLNIIVLDSGQSYHANFHMTVSPLNRLFSEVTQRVVYIIWFAILFALCMLLVTELRKDNGKAGPRRG
jgi:hypothetical protein